MMTIGDSLELHEMYLHLFRPSNLCSEQMQEFILSWDLPHPVDYFFPLNKESFDVIVSEFNSMEVGRRKVIGILLVLFEPFK